MNTIIVTTYIFYYILWYNSDKGTSYRYTGTHNLWTYKIDVWILVRQKQDDVNSVYYFLSALYYVRKL